MSAAELSHDPAENLELLHRVLQHIAENADLLDGPHYPWGDAPFDHTGQWMIVPVATFMLDALALFETERDGLEDGADHEPDEDEHSLGATTGIDQTTSWSSSAGAYDTDLELDRSDYEPEHADDEYCDNEGRCAGGLVWAPDWPPKPGIAPAPRAQGMLPVFASEENSQPRPRPKTPTKPVTHPKLGTYRRIYPPAGSEP
jgi:hypothetical protein